MLLEDVNVVSSHTPLHLAAKNGHMNVVSYFLSCGMDVNLTVSCLLDWWQLHGFLVLLISWAFVQEFGKKHKWLSSQICNLTTLSYRGWQMCSQDMVFFTMKNLATATFVISSLYKTLSHL